MIERREIFKVLGAALMVTRQGAAQHEHGPPAAAVNIEDYAPRFFSDAQYRTIDRLTDIIIPSDDQSPGAHAAGVRFYVDTVLHYEDEGTQQTWRNGLAAVDEAARSSFNKSFGECSIQEQEHIVAVMATNETNPSTELDLFFRLLKRLAVEAYSVSEIGLTRYFGYTGNTAIKEFPGCKHPEHQAI
jgi:Gluconate 2-dehydrogenase subunit 3